MLICLYMWRPRSFIHFSPNCLRGYPYDKGVVISDLKIGILFTLAVSSISVYAILMSGWASQSKYAFLGAIRAAAQMISYEVSIGLIIIAVILCVGSLNITEIV